MSNGSWSENINALYPRPKGRGSTAIFDRRPASIGRSLFWNIGLRKMKSQAVEEWFFAAASHVDFALSFVFLVLFVDFKA